MTTIKILCGTHPFTSYPPRPRSHEQLIKSNMFKDVIVPFFVFKFDKLSRFFSASHAALL